MDTSHSLEALVKCGMVLLNQYQDAKQWQIECCRVQLPVFVTAMWASRRMALAPWPGLEAGGALWFPDLTIPALDLASQTAQVSRHYTVKQ